ncbi:MAG: Asp-tRNA(Asn)/Glu-tRNA(Gln) amidotransferase subunit GatB [Firmicutes bacterium]|nr:Asp-tRNA(Asn)/Glu-tRNA(Gln) amidotransferase subunit GatB [Bacillota bacterium]
MGRYETVIGLEIHVELQTASKLFCGCSARFGSEPNTNCCPVCLGLPGSLPVFNRRAIELAVTAALALNSEVQDKSRFDRKNYFYPDLPKAYQVSQYDQPLAKGGFLEFRDENKSRLVNLERVHLEEEAGKLIHAGESILDAEYSLVDYNRAGIPLLEIVTKPDLRSGSEARLFLENLRLLLLYAGISDCKMEEGSLRCDANISLRLTGSQELGTKAEVKNMNSFKAVEAALNYEAVRQEKILNAGGKVDQETCHWNEETKETIPLRGKEGSSDYRYFPEPDLLPLVIDKSLINKLTALLPESPLQRYQRLQEQYGLAESEVQLFIENRELGDYFESAAKKYSNYHNLANWVQGDLLFQLRECGCRLDQLLPDHLVEILDLLDSGEINRPVAKELLAESLRAGSSPRDLVAKKNLGRIADRDQLLPLVNQVIAENPEAVENFMLGKDKAIAFLVGKVMALSGGRADPGELNQLFRELLKKKNGCEANGTS